MLVVTIRRQATRVGSVIIQCHPRMLTRSIKLRRAAWASLVIAVMVVLSVAGWAAWHRASAGPRVPTQVVTGRITWGVPNIAAYEPIPITITGTTASGSVFLRRFTTRENGHFTVSLPLGRYTVSVRPLLGASQIAGNPLIVTRHHATHASLVVKPTQKIRN